MGAEMGQLPSKLIHRGPETANPITQGHRDELGRKADFNPANVEDILNIILMGDGVGWLLDPILNGNFKGIEMLLRPASFHVYMHKRNWNGHTRKAYQGD
jgi:hypothetical protein